MKTINKITLAILLFTSGLITSCVFTKDIKAKEDDFNQNKTGWLPPDFNPRIGVLLIERSPQPHQQKKTEDYMAKYYPYKYQFISSISVPDSITTHDDFTQNRFILALSYVLVHTHTSIAYKADYHFFDRQLGKEYPRSGIEALRTSGPAISIIKKITNDFQ